MLIADLFERTYGPVPNNPKAINPALLTASEYYRLTNPQGVSHSNEAYDLDLAKLNSYRTASDYPHLIRNLRINGLSFQVRHGNMPEATYDMAVINDEGLIVAKTEDEWGCLLVMVAREYRGFGLGPIITKIAFSLQPDANSGGYTPGGKATFTKVHRDFVRDALTNGLYRSMIAQGKLTTQRAREIIASAKLDIKPSKPKLDLATTDPKNWLLYGEYGGFILYDRKLKTFLDDEIEYSHESFVEKAVKGLILVRDNDENGILVQFGAQTDSIKKFMVKVAASWCANEGIDFWLDEDDLPFADPKTFSIGKVDVSTMMRRAKLTLIGEPLPIEAMIRQERLFRKSVDRHDEFKHRLHDFAYSLYQTQG